MALAKLLATPTAILALGVVLAGCLPHEPLPYSPHYSRIKLADAAHAPAVQKGHDVPPAAAPHHARRAQTVVVPDACITPDVAEQPLYLPPGCANNLNLQMMVERPADLGQGRRPGPAAAAPAVRAAQRYLYGGTEAERRAGKREQREQPAPPSLPQGTRPEPR